MSQITPISLAIIGLIIVLGAIAGVCILLANEKTRTAGFVVLGLGFGVLVCGGGLMSIFHTQRVQMHEQATRAQIARQPELAEYENSAVKRPGRIDASSSVEPVEAGPSPSDALPEEPTAAETSEPSEPPAEDAAAEDKPAAEANDRPYWVGRAPTSRTLHQINATDAHGEPLKGEKVYQVSATIGPYTSRMECDSHLTTDLQEPVAQYVETILGVEAARHVRLHSQYIRQHLVKEQWEEPVDASFGPMVQLHVLLQFDHKTRDIAQREWHQYQVQQRLWYVGGGLAAVLLLLLLAYGYLRGGWSMPGPTVILAVAAAVSVALLIATVMYWASFDSPSVVRNAPRPVDSVSTRSAVDSHGTVVDGPSSMEARNEDAARVAATRWKIIIFAGMLLPLVLLGVGGLAMLVSSKTRPYGIALLGLLAVLICVGVLLLA